MIFSRLFISSSNGIVIKSTEHKLGDGKGADAELLKGLNDHFMGECTEVGMYLAMSRSWPCTAAIRMKSASRPLSPTRSRFKIIGIQKKSLMDFW